MKRPPMQTKQHKGPLRRSNYTVPNSKYQSTDNPAYLYKTFIFQNPRFFGGFLVLSLHMNLILKKVGTSGPLPTISYDAYDGDRKIGEAQLRLKEGGRPSLPENMKSHVYYEVAKEYEGKGYGTQILGLIKEEARKEGMHELLLIAAEKNLASNAIIRKNGGEYLWDYVSPEGERDLKYKLSL